MACIIMKIVQEDQEISEAKVVSVVMDTEPTNIATGRLLPYTWIGCIDHLIELVTGEAFRLNNINFLTNVKSIIGRLHKSSQLTEKLKDQQIAIDRNCIPLLFKQDVSTR